MFRFKLRKKGYPNLGTTMKTAEEIAKEMNLARDKQMEAERQKRPDVAVIQKTRFEALLWVLGKEYASATIR
jgi:hypothetical protein